MSGFFKKLISTLRPAPAQAGPAVSPIDMQDAVMKLFQAHGVEACIKDGGVSVAGGRIWMMVKAYPFPRKSENVVIQFDFVIGISTEKAIVESFVGRGGDERAASLHAIHDFSNGAFHAVLSAMLGGPPCGHVEVEEWAIAGIKRRVTLGLLLMRGEMGVEFGWYAALKQKVSESSLPGGTHWVRVFYGQSGSSNREMEVMLDNQTWEPVQSGMAALDWPVKEKEYYSIRLFFIIQDLA